MAVQGKCWLVVNRRGSGVDSLALELRKAQEMLVVSHCTWDCFLPPSDPCESCEFGVGSGVLNVVMFVFCSTKGTLGTPERSRHVSPALSRVTVFTVLGSSSLH